MGHCTVRRKQKTVTRNKTREQNMVTRNKTREQKCVTRNKPREQKCVTRKKHREQKMVTRNYFIYIQPIRFELGLIGPIESLWWSGIRVLEDIVNLENTPVTFRS